MSAFKDHFSSATPAYAAYRPGYPPALFAWLAGLTQGHELVWDCATGSGQAALGLAAHFRRVLATDASAAQIASAQACSGVDYRTAAAEASGLETASADLITVAQAAHWFDLPAFYAEARRVLKPGGVLALWCYERLAVSPVLDASIAAFYDGLLGVYWPPERQLVEAGYRTLDFPFTEVAPPEFDMTASWNLDQLLGYFSTWSALKRYREATGDDPLPALRRTLAASWVSPDQPKAMKWPLSLRVGRASG